MLKVLVLSLFCLVLGCYSASAPFITPCDPDDTACLIASTKIAIAAFAEGVPSLGIKSIDPLQIPLIDSDHAGLRVIFRDSKLTGLKDCNVENVKNDKAKQKQSITVRCNVLLTGEYSLNGQLIILPVQGNGPFSIEIRDVLMKAVMNLATVTGKDGLPHWHIVDWQHTFKVLTSTKFDFKELFNGNKALGQPVLDFANSQWRNVMEEVAPPIARAIIAELINQVENLYAAVPSSELALNLS